MLSIIAIIFIARTFYALAEKHGKSDWGFAAIGIASYLGGIFIGGLVLGVIIEMISPGLVNDDNSTMFGLLAVPIGILSCAATYFLLKRSWSKPKEIDNSTLDGGLISPESEDRYNKG